MRVAILGGTRFIGAAAVEACVAAGDHVLVVHRGRTEADPLPAVQHAHIDRSDGRALRDAIDRFDPDAVVDTCAFNTQHATIAREAFGSRHHVTLSSMDVYRAFHTVNHGGPARDALPLDEAAPVRGPDARYPYRGQEHPRGDVDMDTYEKLDVEPVVTGAGGCVLRLPMVYGERDPQFRERLVLRRIAAGRTQIPVGPGTWLWTKAYVRDIAGAIRAAATEPEATAGQIFNVGEARTVSMLRWMQMIADAADAEVEFVGVDEDLLPDDLFVTRALAQHVLVDSRRFRDATGWSDADPSAALRASVAWHLDNHVPDEDADWSGDDAALAAAR